MTTSSNPERIKEALADFLRHPHKSSGRGRNRNHKGNRKQRPPWLRKHRRTRTKMPLFLEDKDK